MSSQPYHRVGSAADLIPDRGIYRLRCGAGQDLLDEGARLLDETGRTPLGGAKLLLAVQATRAVHIFESVLALVSIGRGVAASMLNRALLEDALSVHWVATNTEEVVLGQANAHERGTMLGERKLFARYGFSVDDGPLDEEEEAAFKELETKFEGFQLSWTGEKPKALEALIKARWPTSESSKIDFMYEVIQRQNNTLLHASPVGYSLAMTPGRVQANRAGPDQRWPDALKHGAGAFYLIFRTVADEFGLAREVLAERFNLVTCLAKVLDPGAAAKLKPHEDCACESGRPFGACHGS